MQSVFDHPIWGKEAAKHLFMLHQGPRSVAEYAVEFWTLAADAGRNNEALQGVFLKGLNNDIKDYLVARDGPEGVNSQISLTTYLDNHLWEHHWEKQGGTPQSSTMLS